MCCQGVDHLPRYSNLDSRMHITATSMKIFNRITRRPPSSAKLLTRNYNKELMSVIGMVLGLNNPNLKREDDS